MPSDRAWLFAAVAVVATVVLGVGWLFAADVDASPPPVDFDETIQLGMTEETRFDLDSDAAVPRMQVAYSGFRYMVGYHGIERALVDLEDDDLLASLGAPSAVYVTDYTGVGVSLGAEGSLVTERSVGWAAASEAAYVVDSAAMGPDGPLAVPFSDDEAAEAFAAEHGGEVVGWATLLERDIGVGPAVPDRTAVADRHTAADEAVSRADDQLDRPVSVVVGEDADTIQAAVDGAPPETTVLVPAGTYEETVMVDRPVTLRGEGAVIDGGGAGTVVRLTADGAALTGVSIDGVGDQHQDPDAAVDDPDAWDQNIELGYGHGDAGVAAIGAAGVVVADVTIDTPATGVQLRDAPGAVVQGVTVRGPADWMDGFMGVMAMRSSGVVEGTVVEGGRDGVYLHRSGGMAVRDNTFVDGRYGIHLMHTSGSLLAANTVRDQALGGVMLMTDPAANAIVGNDVRRSAEGITTVGTANLVADNVVVDNDHGLRMVDHDSHYVGNVVLGNAVGARVAGFLPTNTVVGNDFVDNGQSLDIGFGALEVWSTADDGGNYWGVDQPSVVGAGADRPFAPAHPVDARLDRVDGAATLANAPALAAVDAVRHAVPGLGHGVVDRHPRATPANPDRLEIARTPDDEVDPT